MNIQLKSGQVYTDPETQYSYDKGFGKIRNLNFAIISGTMSDPENFNGRASVSITFYNDESASISDLKPLYRIDLVFNNLDIISILDIDGSTGYSISEKKIYDTLLNNTEYTGLFEYV